MRVLVVACHPDDETLGAGGTIARHVMNGDSVQVCVLTDGVGARHNHSAQQKECAAKACAVLGVHDVVFCDLPDQRLDSLPLLDVIHPLEACVADHRPDVVYTHFAEDANQDHRAAFRATLVACRPVPGSSVKRLLAYETASSTEWGGWPATGAFTPTVYVDINQTLDQKLDAMAVYEQAYMSEVKAYPHPRSYEAIVITARRHGVTVGVEAGEAFMLIREIG